VDYIDIMKKAYGIASVFVILLVLGLFATRDFGPVAPDQNILLPYIMPIENFEDCSNAGFAVMESYPRQCRTDTGEHFVEVVEPDTIQSSCDESYPTVCIAVYPPDLDCSQIPHRYFVVVGDDPHGFDGDNDGFGCES